MLREVRPDAVGIPWGVEFELGGGHPRHTPTQGIPKQLGGRSSVIWGGCRRWGRHPSSSSSLPASAHPSAMGGAAPAPFIIICGQVKCAGNSCSGRLSAEPRGGGHSDGGEVGGWALPFGCHPTAPLLQWNGALVCWETVVLMGGGLGRRCVNGSALERAYVNGGAVQRVH